MTLFEAIKSDIILSDLQDSKITLAFELRGVNHRSVADVSSLKDLELVTADLYKEFLKAPKFSEGDLTIEYDKAELQRYISEIGLKYEDENLGYLSASGEIIDITDEW